MLTLSIDTAGAHCAVALWAGAPDGGALAGVRDIAMPRGHGEALFGLIGEALDEAGAAPGDISRVVALRGPGTFTGLRIGLAAARGLALALTIPAIGVTTFELIAAGDLAATGETRARLIAIDARRGELYLQLVGADLAGAGEPAVLSPEAAARMFAAGGNIAVGSGAEALAAAARDAGLEIAWRASSRSPPGLLARLGAGRAAETAPATPLYVRAPDAKPQAAPTLRAPAT